MGHTTDLLAECASSLGNLTSATGGLTSALEHITTVARKIEQRFRELEEKEDYLKKLSEMVVSKQQELLSLEVELREKNSSLVQRNQEVIMKEEKWSETEKRMSEHAAKMNNKIQLNVGGQKFATSKVTLLEFKGSFFEALIMSEHTQNADAAFFIDRDPKYFPIVLNYMRDGKFRNSDIKFVDINELMDEFAFFKIPFPHNQINLNVNVTTYSTPTTSTQTTQQSSYDPPSTQSTTHEQVTPAPPAQWSCAPDATSPAPASPAQQNSAAADAKKKEKFKFEGGGDLLSVAFRDQIKQWIPERRFALLYKATRDGFGFKDFHAKCDNKGPTLTVIQAKEGFLFGGFTPDSFDSSGEFRNFPTAFIFTLTNPHNIPPTRYNLKRGNTAAIRCLANSGPVFGDGDIRVENNADSEASFIYFPASYFDTTNQRKLTFTGTRKFFTKDLEVYSVI